MDSRVIKINEKLFDDYVNNVDDRNKKIYEKINERVKLLNLPKNKKEVLIRYKEQITDPYKLAKHYNIMRLFKSDKYIDEKFQEAIKNNFDCKTINNIYNKIKIIKNIERKYGIFEFCVTNNYLKFTNRLDTKSVWENNPLKNDEYNLIKNIFRISKNIPQNNDELILMYVTMIKNICGSEIIISKQIQNNNERKRYYDYNNEHIQFHYNLASYYLNTNNFPVNIFIEDFNFDLDELNLFINDAKQFLNRYYINKK